ncbi:MAG TPA: hypothetical protein VGG46_01890 [Terriglobales bacterium]|jgi:hypothetical protein
MPKKPTSADAQLVLQLYDFRREAEMRKARAWFAGFRPASANDILEVVNNFGTPENAWFRQVTSYWDMAAALVLSGALNEDLFTDTNGEMWFVFSKLHPFLAEARKTSKRPQLLLRLEKMAKKSKIGRERLSSMEKQFAGRREAAAGKSS